MDEARCQSLIDDYYRINPEVKLYSQDRVVKARRNGYARDMFGRIRYIPELSCPIRRIESEGARQAANMPITAGAQGIIKLATKRLKESRDQHQLPFQFLLQVHDELIFEVKEEFLDMGFTDWAETVMEGVVRLEVPVVAESKTGERWGSLRKVEDIGR